MEYFSYLNSHISKIIPHHLHIVSAVIEIFMKIYFLTAFDLIYYSIAKLLYAKKVAEVFKDLCSLSDVSLIHHFHNPASYPWLFPYLRALLPIFSLGQ